jgi:dihydroneopterin aldolase
MPRIDLEVVVITEIGIAPTEIGTQQSLNVRVGVEIDADAANKAARTADIRDTLDYGHCRNIVRKVFEGCRFDLLEEPTLLIKRQIEELPHVRSVVVSLAKAHPWPDVPSVRFTA